MNRSHVGQAPSGVEFHFRISRVTLLGIAAFVAVLLIATLSFAIGRRSSAPRDPLNSPTVAGRAATATEPAAGGGESARERLGAMDVPADFRLATGNFAVMAHNVVVQFIESYDGKPESYVWNGMWHKTDRHIVCQTYIDGLEKQEISLWNILYRREGVFDVSVETLEVGGTLPTDKLRVWQRGERQDADKFVPVVLTDKLKIEHKVWFRVGCNGVGDPKPYCSVNEHLYELPVGAEMRALNQ